MSPSIHILTPGHPPGVGEETGARDAGDGGVPSTAVRADSEERRVDREIFDLGIR